MKTRVVNAPQLPNEKPWSTIPGSALPSYWTRERSPLGTPFILHPQDHPLAVASGDTESTILATPPNLTTFVDRITCVASSSTASDTNEQTDLYPLRIQIESADGGSFPLVPAFTPMEAVASRGQSIEGRMLRAYPLPPNSQWLIRVKNDSGRALNVFLAFHTYRRTEA